MPVPSPPIARLRSAIASLAAAVCLVSAAAPAHAAGVRVLAEDGAGVTLEATYVFAGLDTVRSDGAVYGRVRPDASGLTSGWGAPGAPEVPVLPAVVGVPPGSRPVLTLVSVESDPVAWPRPMPVPRSIPRRDGMADERLEIDPPAYAAGVTTPGRWAEIGGLQGLRGLATLPVRFFPVSIEGATGRGAVARRIVVRIDFRAPSAPGGTGGGAPLPQSIAPPAPLDGVFDAAVVNRRTAKAWREPFLPIAPPTGRRPFGAVENPAWKILVTATGLVRVPFGALRTDPFHVFPADVPIAQLVLTLRDFDESTLLPTETPVAIEVHDANANGVFDGSDDFVFYAQDLVSRYGKKDYRENLTRANVYWLTWRAEGGPRIATVDGWPATAAPTVPVTFTDSVHVEEDRRFERLRDDSSTEFADQYFYYRAEELPAVTEFDVTIPLGAHPSTGTARFRAVFQGIGGPFLPFNTHRLALRLQKDPSSTADTLAVPTTEFSGDERYILDQDVPLSAFGETSVTMHYSATYQYGGESEQPGSHAPLDYTEILYSRYYTSNGDLLRFTDGGARGDVEFHIDAFADTSLVVFDVTNPIAPIRLSLANRVEQIVLTGGAYTARVRAVVSAPRTYVASRLGAATVPGSGDVVGDDASSLAAEQGAVDWIAIAPESLAADVQPLEDLRRGQGYRTRVARLQDVYDEFGGGLRTEYAIRRYLAVVRPAYTLLVGDGNADQLEVNPNSQSDVMPVHLTVYYGEAIASDNWYACIDSLGRQGVDIVPDVALGRFPASTRAELQTIVQRTVGYEQSSSKSPWRERLMLLADDQYSTDYSFGTNYTYRGWELAFEQAHDAVIGQLGSSYPLARPETVRFYLADSTDAYRQRSGGSPSITAVKLYVQTVVKPFFYPVLMSDSTQASSIIYYQGHGNRWVFTHEDIVRDFTGTCGSYGDGNVRCNIRNFGFPHVLFGFACHMTEFDLPGELDPLINDSIGEKDMLLTGSAGAVATYGSTGFEFAPPNVSLEIAINGAFYVTPPTGNAIEPRLALGKVLLTAFPAYAAARPFPEEQKAIWRYVLMGDPALRLGVAPPSLDVTFNGEPVTDGMRIRSLGTGTDSIAANIEDETGIDSTSIVVRETNPSATLPVTLASYDVPSIRDRAYRLSAPVALRFGDYTIQVAATGRDGRASTLTLRVSSQVTVQINGRPYRPDVDRFVPPDVRVQFLIQAPVPLAADSITATLDGVPIAVGISGADTTWTVTADFASQPLSVGPHTLGVHFAGFTYELVLEVADRLALSSLWAFPNPFAGRTGIQYTLTQDAQQVRIRVYTLAGRLVCEMPGETRAGLNVVGWDGRDADGDEVGNGVYVYRVTAWNTANARVEAMGKIARAR